MLPDLLAQWNPAIPIGKIRLSSPKLGVLEGHTACRGPATIAPKACSPRPAATSSRAC